MDELSIPELGSVYGLKASDPWLWRSADVADSKKTFAGSNRYKRNVLHLSLILCLPDECNAALCSFCSVHGANQCLFMVSANRNRHLYPRSARLLSQATHSLFADVFRFLWYTLLLFPKPFHGISKTLAQYHYAPRLNRMTCS